MEALNQTISDVNAQTRMSLPNQQISTPTTKSNIPREQHAALFAIINKARLLNGWTTRTAQELDSTIRTWAEMFADYDIPVTAYHELYKRAFDIRQIRLRDGGREVPQMDAVLLVSQWTGSFGLKAEYRQREIDARKTLPSNAEAICQDCYGTGFKTVRNGHYAESQKCTHGNMESQ